MFEPSLLTILGNFSKVSGQVFLPELFTKFMNRYDFQNQSEYSPSTTDQKLEFFLGKFEETAVESLAVFNDGLVLRSRSNTNFLDRFARDVFQFLKEDWGLSFVTTSTINMMYQSVIIVETDKDILAPLASTNFLSNQLQMRLSQTVGLDRPFHPFGMTISTEDASLAGLKPSAFRIERRAGIEFNLNQYFCVAPLRTDDHIALLEEWEKWV